MTCACGSALVTPTERKRSKCRGCWAAYMREWSRRNRAVISAQGRARVARLKAEGASDVVTCVRCGKSFERRPNEIAYRTKACRWCRRHLRDGRHRERVLNPVKFLARQLVSRALQAGRLTRLPCADCGAERVEAHHTDYSKPLDVTWLCRACHLQRHRDEAAA